MYRSRTAIVCIKEHKIGDIKDATSPVDNFHLSCYEKRFGVVSKQAALIVAHNANLCCTLKQITG